MKLACYLEGHIHSYEFDDSNDTIFELCLRCGKWVPADLESKPNDPLYPSAYVKYFSILQKIVISIMPVIGLANIFYIVTLDHFPLWSMMLIVFGFMALTFPAWNSHRRHKWIQKAIARHRRIISEEEFKKNQEILN
jgi:hypothetical protein